MTYIRTLIRSRKTRRLPIVVCLGMRPQGCCRPNTTMLGSHSLNIRTLIKSCKTRRLPIVVNVTVAVWLLLQGKIETLARFLGMRPAGAAAVLYYYIQEVFRLDFIILLDQKYKLRYSNFHIPLLNHTSQIQYAFHYQSL